MNRGLLVLLVAGSQPRLWLATRSGVGVSNMCHRRNRIKASVLYATAYAFWALLAGGSTTLLLAAEGFGSTNALLFGILGTAVAAGFMRIYDM
jgi:hypothetical protein